MSNNIGLIPTKYPELTNEALKRLTPVDDDCKIPHESRCKARQKTCKKCEYRFKKSDRNDPTSWFCPECGSFRRCRKARVTGYTTCSQHGSGLVHIGRPGGSLPTKFTHTKWMPERLAERFEEALYNPELLSMKNQLATLDARWKDVLSRLENASFMEKDNFKEIKRAYRDFDDGKLDGDELIERVRKSVDDLRNEQSTWEDVASLMESQRKLSETEMKRMMQIGQILTVEEANALVGGIRIIMLKNLKAGTVIDDSIIKQIQYEIMGLTYIKAGGLGQPGAPARPEQV